jgi:uncharacterized membrane protein YwzB
MEENHPWMKFFTWVTVAAGVGAISYTLSNFSNESLPWLITGICAVIVGFWALAGTDEYKRFSASSGLTKLMAFLSSTAGALLSSFFIIFIFMAYAALKQNQRDGLS